MYKVIVPRANGSGALGETLSSPVVLKPNEGYTQTFIGIGAFDNENEANNALKYLKTKFSRTMLSVLKNTQHNEKDTWRKVPLQDFTDNSDIDWSKAIPEIDKQLYKKYGLTQEEIDFIETNVKEMA
jgi:type II restriction enzyme